eukprot:1154190-Pelagomonas_calceolata.AAC.5
MQQQGAMAEALVLEPMHMHSCSTCAQYSCMTGHSCSSVMGQKLSGEEPPVLLASKAEAAEAQQRMQRMHERCSWMEQAA